MSSTSQPHTSNPLVILGPTASGKSALALELARRSSFLSNNAASSNALIELLYVDSMAVYRGMDIGTAKPSPAEQAEVPHYLIDIADPSEPFTVVDYQSAFEAASTCVAKRAVQPLLVCGTGLYLRAVIDHLTPPTRYPEVVQTFESQPTETLFERLRDLDPLGASRMQSTNRRRIERALEVTLGSGQPFSSFGPGMDSYDPVPYTLIGIDIARDKLDERITQRYAEQLEAGFVGEVRELLAHPGGLYRTAAQALGYKELSDHLRGETSLDEAIEIAIKRTRRFARRQQRWFRRDPRITWIRFGSPAQMADQVLKLVEGIAEGTAGA